MKPLLYLEYRQLVNAIKNTLRSPKRLIPALVIGAWVISWFLQSVLIFSGNGPRAGLVPRLWHVSEIPTDLIRVMVFLCVSVGSVLVIYIAFNSGMMVFSLAQVDFMFPTPISRKKVLLYKLVNDYVKSLRHGDGVVTSYRAAGVCQRRSQRPAVGDRQYSRPGGAVPAGRERGAHGQHHLHFRLRAAKASPVDHQGRPCGRDSVDAGSRSHPVLPDRVLGMQAFFGRPIHRSHKCCSRPPRGAPTYSWRPYA